MNICGTKINTQKIWDTACSSTTRSIVISIASAALLIGGALTLKTFIPKLIPVLTKNIYYFKDPRYLLIFADRAALIKSITFVALGSTAIGMGIFGMGTQAKKIYDNAKEKLTPTINEWNFLNKVCASVETLGKAAEVGLGILLIIGGASIVATACQHYSSLYITKEFITKGFLVVNAHAKLAIAGTTIGCSLGTLGVLMSMRLGFEKISRQQFQDYNPHNNHANLSEDL